MPGASLIARLLPRSVRYWVILQAALEVSRRNPKRAVPEITWAEMTEVLD